MLGHCKMLRRAFKRLIAAGMTLKPLYLTSCARSWEFTHKEGIKPSAERVKTFQDMRSAPKDKKTMLRFVGNVNFQLTFHSPVGSNCKSLVRYFRKDMREDARPWEHLRGRLSLCASLSTHYRGDLMRRHARVPRLTYSIG
eukprot:2435336-Pleurochrysis_carterae.AAC.3